MNLEIDYLWSHKCPKKWDQYTLIALVITIIVLLILAGVTINTLVGDNGLLQKVGEAKQISEEATALEKIQTEVVGSYDFTGKIDVNILNRNLSNINGLTYKENILSNTNRINELPVIVKLEGYHFKIEATGVINKLKFISKEENFTGYYADINDDGIVDGVIFADLISGSSKEIQQWENNSSFGCYTIPNPTEINEYKNYYISKEKYKWANLTESKPVLSSIGTGKERFYIMSLNDFTTPEYIDEADASKNYPEYASYYWYKNAYGNLKSSVTSVKFKKGITNTQTMIEIWNANGGTGGFVNATQENQDIWKHVQTKFEEGWFIPSREEWAIFANELGITKVNYNSIYQLKSVYWASTIYNTDNAWQIYFGNANIGINGVNNTNAVRLAKIF